jgi:hypothetical protein
MFFISRHTVVARYPSRTTIRPTAPSVNTQTLGSTKQKFPPNTCEVDCVETNTNLHKLVLLPKTIIIEFLTELGCDAKPNIRARGSGVFLLYICRLHRLIPSFSPQLVSNGCVFYLVCLLNYQHR